ncbi:GYF DOMAIN-CONTAINING PROTEIN [Salix koriyanagi]|uniref:GYF DOMAIN-CONTAINING PROTEIN n=1 Tax=Salix koriyanagi TaxID=2511006 RepID=A0A9Q0Z7D1_9ROSI|nr:GYF DOMAIN-CONTAINING PROTEIN [Salix koriyanagi]
MKHVVPLLSAGMIRLIFICHGDLTPPKVVLKGIDKGDIVSSDAPQISKEGSLGRNSTGSSQPRRAQLGNKEDVPRSESLNDLMGGHETYSDGFSHERKTPYQGSAQNWK